MDERDTATGTGIDERRSGRRVYRPVPVTYDAGNGEQSATASDLSESGLHLVTNDVARVGSRIRVEIDLDGESTCHDCEVMWAIRVPDHLKDSMVYGMGLRFLHPPRDWSARFRRWRENPARQ